MSSQPKFDVHFTRACDEAEVHRLVGQVRTLLTRRSNVNVAVDVVRGDNTNRRVLAPLFGLAGAFDHACTVRVSVMGEDANAFVELERHASCSVAFALVPPAVFQTVVSASLPVYWRNDQWCGATGAPVDGEKGVAFTTATPPFSVILLDLCARAASE